MDRTPDNINVDLGELRMFADTLRTDTDLGLRPGVSRAEQELQLGVRFGLAAPGGQVATSRELLGAALERAQQNTARQVRAAEILTTTIEQILANYRDGEHIAAEHMDTVEQTLASAITAAELAARPPAPVWRDGGEFLA